MTHEPKFLRRFEQIRSSLWRYQGWLGLAATCLAAATALGFLAWSDYDRELSRTARAIGLAVASVATLLVAWRWLIAPLRWWTQPRTAFEIEARFPQLGQRIRTVVQYAGQPEELMDSEGVKPSLVEALETETEQQAEPLPLDRIVRWRRAYGLAALAVVPAAILAFLAIRSQEWRIAIQRAVLIERPYTTVEVKPGDVLVDQGEDVPVAVELKGRPRKSVVLQTRPAGKVDSPWKSEKIDPSTKGPAARREAKVEKVKDPLEYRVVAGPAGSPSYAIRVRYPLAVKEFDVKVTPPEYTRLEPKTTKGGDVQAVEGSVATFRISFDAEPSEAALEMVDPAQKAPKKGEPAPGPTILPLKREGNALVATLDLSKDLDYKVVAKTLDGRVLPKNKYRIDVREDRAPRVVFDEPDEALEVHPIAEVRHRARVDDDFGLTRAGIVYRFNDGEEKTLVAKDFPVEGKQKPKLAATLEEMLLLETLNATPLDSVTYYAFAEDNFPGGPRRTETDLRYIDFRVFKREYKLSEPGSGDGDPIDLIALDELIARQRVNLNRANRLAKHKPTDRTPADDPLKITGFEETLLNLTKEFTEGIEQLADARVDALHKALDAMQASIDSLDGSRIAEAPPAMAEALKNLVAARRDLLFLIANGNSKLAEAMKAFDRKQAQKIRKPKSKDEEAEEVANRLEELAQEEEFVYATIAASEGGGVPDPKAKSGEAEKGEPKEAEKKEAEKGETKEAGKKDAESKDAMKKDQGEGTPKGEGEKGQDGAKPKGGQGNAKGEGQGEEGEGGQGEPKKLDRRAVADKQQAIADEVRDLEEKLKRIEAASDLAKARMAKAAETVEKASGSLTRGNSKEAAEAAKTGAGMLHELARQVKGEITREATDELAMARDLADELARREAEFADRNQSKANSGGPEGKEEKGEKGQGEPDDKDGKGDKGEGKPEDKDGNGQGKAEGKEGKGKKGQGKGEGMEGEGEKGQGQGKGQGEKPGRGGRGGLGGWEALTEAEQVERMAEMAKTLEEWLKQIDKRGEGKAADAVREILDQGNVAEIVERAGRMGEVLVLGKQEELSKEARELATKLEVIGQALELLHRGIVAPQMAAMVEFDRRLADLTAKLADLKTEAEVAAWRREVAALIRDLEKAGVEGAAELAEGLRAGGGWHWDEIHHRWVLGDATVTLLKGVSFQIKDRIQEMILKDLASARDEATPPMFREMVERYYEVISKGAKMK